jgi:hypothetical protein
VIDFEKSKQLARKLGVFSEVRWLKRQLFDREDLPKEKEDLALMVAISKSFSKM